MSMPVPNPRENLFIVADGLEFQSELPPKLGFNITKFTGWNDGAPARSSSIEIPMGDGEFDVPVFKAARSVSIEGFCLSRSVPDLGQWQSRFTALGALGTDILFQASEFGRTLWGNAKPDGTPEWDATDGLARAEFAVDLRFRDPRKYGETRTFASGVPAYHYGNYWSTPYMQVAGAMPGGYTINGPAGKKYTVTAPVAAGAPHYIDMATGILRVGGLPLFGVVSQGDTWSLPPGKQTVTTLTPVSGSGTLTVSVVDTYV